MITYSYSGAISTSVHDTPFRMYINRRQTAYRHARRIARVCMRLKTEIMIEFFFSVCADDDICVGICVLWGLASLFSLSIFHYEASHYSIITDFPKYLFVCHPKIHFCGTFGRSVCWFTSQNLMWKLWMFWLNGNYYERHWFNSLHWSLRAFRTAAKMFPLIFDPSRYSLPTIMMVFVTVDRNPWLRPSHKWCHCAQKIINLIPSVAARKVYQSLTFSQHSNEGRKSSEIVMTMLTKTKRIT